MENDKLDITLDDVKAIFEIVKINQRMDYLRENFSCIWIHNCHIDYFIPNEELKEKIRKIASKRII